MTAKIEKSRAVDGGAKVFGAGTFPLTSNRLKVGLDTQLHFMRESPKTNGTRRGVLSQGITGPNLVSIIENSRGQGFALVSTPEIGKTRRFHFPVGSRLVVESVRVLKNTGQLKCSRQFVRAT